MHLIVNQQAMRKYNITISTYIGIYLHTNLQVIAKVTTNFIFTNKKLRFSNVVT